MGKNDRWVLITRAQLSLSLSDDFSKLAPLMFPGSEMTRKFGNGRTKTTAIIKGVELFVISQASKVSQMLHNPS